MNRIIRWVSTFSVLALSVVVSSCDNPETTQPELSPVPMGVTSLSGQRFVVAVEKDSQAGSVSAQIGRAGGMLQLGDHSLHVASGAVTETTKFTMTRDANSPLRVKLTAGRQSENDVGAVGFKAPVVLSVGYANAVGLPSDPSTITVVYFRPDGLVEELETRVDYRGRHAVAQLPHFSLFGLAWPW